MMMGNHMMTSPFMMQWPYTASLFMHAKADCGVSASGMYGQVSIKR